MLFKNFPKTLATINGEFVTVTDIFRRVAAKAGIDDYTILESFTVPSGWTPEIVASRYYGNPYYHWVILITNNIVDVREEWPKSQSDLVKYCIKKYNGIENIYDVHHYETDDGLIVDADYADGYKTAIQNFQYEEMLNDKKSEIKLLDKRYLSEFLTDYNSLIRK
jgi:hypothetical protein